MYGFESGHSKKAIAANWKPAEELKREKGFIYKVSLLIHLIPNLLLKLCKDLLLNGDKPWKWMYNHPIIQKAIDVMWFQNKCNEGVVLTDMFKPIPIPAIAFVLTAVCSINLHMGSMIEFLLLDQGKHWQMADRWENECDLLGWWIPLCYNGHIEALQNYSHHMKQYDLIGWLQCRLFNYGW